MGNIVKRRHQNKKAHPYRDNVIVASLEHDFQTDKLIQNQEKANTNDLVTHQLANDLAEERGSQLDNESDLRDDSRNIRQESSSYQEPNLQTFHLEAAEHESRSPNDSLIKASAREKEYVEMFKSNLFKNEGSFELR
jgi:hypothetical protein